MMMRALFRNIVVCIVCLLGVLNVGQAQSEDIGIGVIAGITGLGASYGLGITRGAEMAARDINSAGGINGRNIKLTIVDDASNPPRSAIAMRRLTTANVSVIVGGWGSPQVLANMDIVEQVGIPYIVVGATNPRITAPTNKWTFRVIPSDAVMASQLANIATKNLATKRIAVINDNNDYGTGNREIFIAALTREGIKPVEVQSYQSSDTDFSAQLGRLRDAKPDAIAIFGTVPAAPAIMKQARKLGITARFLGTGGLANEALIALAPTASEGTVLTSFFSEEVDPEARGWADRYRQEYAGQSEPPRPVLAAWEYRAIRDIAAPCLKSADSNMVHLRDCIARWRGKLPGVSGEAYFDATGQLVHQPVVVEIRDGDFRLLQAAK